MTTLDDVRDHLAEDTARNRWIGIWIGTLAVLLALGGWGGGNAALDAQRLNVDAANAWAWYQAKNIRRTILMTAMQQGVLSAATTPDLSSSSKQVILSYTRQWKEQYDQLSSEPSTGEGIEQLEIRARAIEKARDAALKADSAFGLAMAALQIAVVLASVAIVLGATLPLWGSGLAGALGAALMLQGFVG